MKSSFAPFILLTFALGAQAPVPVPPPPGSVQMSPAGMAPSSDAEPSGETVLAHLGTRTIVYGDFVKWLKVIAGPRAGMVRKNAGNRTQAIKQFLDLQVLDAKARKLNLQKTREFKDLLAAQQQQCFAKVLMDEEREGGEGWKLQEKINNPTPEETYAFFQKNMDRFATPERFTARHILVHIGSRFPGDNGLTEEAARDKVAKLQEELRNGKKLEDLAKDYSDDSVTKSNGGLCKDIAFGSFAKEFEAAVRAQEIGKVGDPVKTMYGYHLIEVLARSPKQAAEFDQVKDAVKKQMIPERRDQMTKAFFEDVKREVGFREATPDEKAEPAKAAGGKPGKATTKAKPGK